LTAFYEAAIVHLDGYIGKGGKMTDPTIIQAKRYGVFTCREQVKLLTAARQMAEEDISALVVVDKDGYLLGIITRTDLMRALCEHEDWAKMPVEDYMSRQVVTVSPKDHLREVAQLLLDKGIHRVVAVQVEDGKPKPVAVISAADIVYHMSKGN
jgi:signal-transduction protein with cAMP-binding, CBS, and nucleotidyltransferase domain